MRKRLVIIILLAVAQTVPGQANKATGQKEQIGQNANPAPIATDAADKHGDSQANQSKAESDPPEWYAALERPDWWLVLVAAITGGLISWQSFSTQKAARGAELAADAALLNAKAFINAERPWILVKASPSKRREFGWELLAVNKGRTPAEVVAQADNCVAIDIMASLPDVAKYGKSNIYPTPQIILPEETFVVGEITQYSLFKNDQGSITRFRNMETEGYVYGSIIYRDLLSPPSAEPHETRWCFSILPWQDQEMLLQEHGWKGNEYTRHT